MGAIGAPCHICGGTLEALDATVLEVQVTSDCRPWPSSPVLANCTACGVVQKPVTAAWQQEADRIYSGYAVYAQGGGAEQASFDASSGEGVARSERIVRWLAEQVDLPASGRLLDIGCGNGSFLRAFGDLYPGWEMTGAELDERNRQRIEALRGVTSFHAGPIEELTETFDIIVMIHALEHIPGPLSFLRTLSNKLRPSGKVLIEVPDLDASPFDLAIADHCTHFSQTALQSLLNRAGYTVASLDATCIAKEITTLATWSHDEFITIPPPPRNDRCAAQGHLEWLQGLFAASQAEATPLGIFGSSIAATWLAARLGGKASFFVDEDSNRIGSRHMGIPILSVDTAPPGARILMPMRYDIATKIARRLSDSKQLFVIPPSPRQSYYRRT